ncbi:MAG: metal ABC transporter substrate-binding protein [Candidatus Fimadaptatus sp.]
MARRLLALAAALCLGLCAAATPARAGAEFRILTSFYPMYLLTANVAGGIDGVEVQNMAEQNVGCLHDYALRTGDMRLISSADVVVINGAGMEGFVDKVIGDMGKPVIDASAGIELIGGDGHDEDGHDDGENDGDGHDDDGDHDEDEHDDHDGHDHGDVNAHIWMSPRQAILQVENIAAGLIEADPAHAQSYRDNAERYKERLRALDAEVSALLEGAAGARIVTSHPAFEYMARDYGIEIVASLGQEPGEMPRTRDMAELVDTVREMGISALFVEKAYAEKAAEVLARETGIAIYTLDSLTSGELSAEAYEAGILADARTLKEALEDADA